MSAAANDGGLRDMKQHESFIRVAGFSLFCLLVSFLIWEPRHSFKSIQDRLKVGMSITDVYKRVPRRFIRRACERVEVTYGSDDVLLRAVLRGSEPTYAQIVTSLDGTESFILLFDSNLKLKYVPKYVSEISQSVPEHRQNFMRRTNTNEVFPILFTGAPIDSKACNSKQTGLQELPDSTLLLSTQVSNLLNALVSNGEVFGVDEIIFTGIEFTCFLAFL